MENPVVTVEVLTNMNELWTLENAFLNAVGEEPMPEANMKRLEAAVKAEKIVFFAARLHGKAIGMCSVSSGFSTYACRSCGVFDDFFVLPEYRGQGTARLLVKAAQAWCRERDYASLTVGCSQSDQTMYQSLGFETELGVMLACNL